MQNLRDIQTVKQAARRGAVAVVAAALAVVGLLAAEPASAQSRVTVPAGTTMALRVETAVDSSRARPGDEFTARVSDPVVVRGVEAIPSGTVVRGRVISVASNRSFGRPSGASLKIDELVSPGGATVAVIADLADSSGTPFVTVDNLRVGTEVQLRINRPVTLTDEFFGGQGGGGTDVFDTQATVTQAQITLRDLGYYTGRVDGRLTPATRGAISAFQRDERLPVTGFLDRRTLDRLGLISESGSEVTAVNVISADARVRNNDRLNVRIVTQGANTMQLFEDHFRRNNTLHIYVRGFRSLGYQGGTNELNVVLQPDEWQGINRIVVHGSGNDIVIRNTDVVTGDVFTVQEAAALEREIGDLLDAYARALGVRYNRVTGQLQFTSWNYRENEVELLFALNSLSTTSRLYTQLLRTSSDPQAINGATDVYSQQATAVERALNRTRSQRANVVRQGWAAMQDDVARLSELARQTAR